MSAGIRFSRPPPRPRRRPRLIQRPHADILPPHLHLPRLLRIRRRLRSVLPRLRRRPRCRLLIIRLGRPPIQRILPINHPRPQYRHVLNIFPPDQAVVPMRMPEILKLILERPRLRRIVFPFINRPRSPNRRPLIQVNRHVALQMNRVTKISPRRKMHCPPARLVGSRYRIIHRRRIQVQPIPARPKIANLKHPISRLTSAQHPEYQQQADPNDFDVIHSWLGGSINPEGRVCESKPRSHTGRPCPESRQFSILWPNCIFSPLPVLWERASRRKPARVRADTTRDYSTARTVLSAHRSANVNNSSTRLGAMKLL